MQKKYFCQILIGHYRRSDPFGGARARDDIKPKEVSPDQEKDRDVEEVSQSTEKLNLKDSPSKYFYNFSNYLTQC